MIVYRVETPTNIGPYYDSKSDEWDIAIAAHRKGTEQHPAAYEDGILEIRGRQFGFQSIDAMRAWFNGAERLYLSTHDICLSCYATIGTVCLGHKQLTFEIRHSTLIWRKPLSHF